MNLIQKLKAGHYHLLIIVIAACLAYANSLRNGYAVDDELYALNTKVAEQGFRAIPGIFTSHTFYDVSETGYAYRPMALASFAVEYGLFGQHAPLSHLINLICYLIILCILYQVLNALFRNPWLAFFASLLFALHPLHTEVVDNLKCRDELLSLLGALLAFRSAVRYALDGKARRLGFVFFWFAFALFSKIACAPYFIAIPFALHFFLGTKPKQLVFVMLSVGAAMLIVRLSHNTLPPGDRHLLFHENSLVGASFGTRLATAFYVLGHYLQLHIFPQPLLFYYGYSRVPVVGWNNMYVLASLAVHAALLVFVILKYKSRSLVVFGICFYAVHIFMFSNIVAPAPGLVAERFALSASLGFCIALTGLLFGKLPAGAGWNTVLKAKPVYIAGIAVCLFAARTMARNPDWKSKETLYTHDIVFLKNSAKANLLYGSLLSQKGLETRNVQLVSSAAAYFAAATRIVPRYALAWENLGTCYYFLGQGKEALEAFNKAIAANPGYAKSYFDKGVLFQQNRQALLAEQYFRESIRLDPHYAPGYSFLGKLYQSEGRTGEAIRTCEKGAPYDQSDMLESDLTAYYMHAGDTLAALSHAEKAAELNPKNTERLNSLAYYFSLKGDEAKAAHYRNLAAKQH